jgi:hypothetical protein
MQFTCILTSSQIMQMEAQFVRMQAKYREDERFRSHNLTLWPRISEMFPNNLPNMQENASIEWGTHFELN